jgi:transposase-like protein
VIFLVEGSIMGKAIEYPEYWCYNEECEDYGIKGLGNIVLKQRYGKDNHALLRCRTCGHCFAETRGTMFFGLNTSTKEVLDTLAMLPEKGSIRGVARASGHDKNTICDWIKKAAAQCRQVTEYFLKNLHMSQVQVDEFWSFCKKNKKI